MSRDIGLKMNWILLPCEVAANFIINNRTNGRQAPPKALTTSISCELLITTVFGMHGRQKSLEVFCERKSRCKYVCSALSSFRILTGLLF